MKKVVYTLFCDGCGNTTEAKFTGRANGWITIELPDNETNWKDYHACSKPCAIKIINHAEGIK